MSPATLLLGAALFLVAGALLGVVGLLVRARHAPPEATRARNAYALWWGSAAAVLLLSGARPLIAAFGAVDPVYHAALLHALAGPVAVALASLVYYLLWLYTGSERILPPLGAAYTLLYLFVELYFVYLGPWTVEVGSFDARLVSTRAAEGPLTSAFGVLVAGPVVLATLAYASLGFRLREREHRFRVATVSAAFLLWFGAILGAFLAGGADEAWFPLAYAAPGVVAAGLAVAAFRPPRPVRRWIHRALPGGGRE